MDIELSNIGKKFNRNWIFRKIDFQIYSGDMVSITGHNGSGKSTLLQIISGFITPSEGNVHYAEDGEDLQTQFGFVAPYQNVIDEFTLLEHLEFHSRFKQPLMNYEEMIELAGLEGSENKLVQEFSSGMKQRLRLSLAFFYEANTIFLDEPTSNLDKSGEAWYQKLILANKGERTLIVASNQEFEIQEAKKNLFVENFK
ncbi:ABC transporter ATP-binding protein [Marinoscillum sp.]|uniref:ABC transporter ATP-binding protein n=1 Tax=Marinoscillum sp. TaxID=2024838 RepID=UPI003BA9143F